MLTRVNFIGGIMPDASKHAINDCSFLRLLIALNYWEGSEKNEIRTESSRELFFQLAESLLISPQAPKYQTLKFLAGRLTERAMRQRVREFEALGLVNVLPGSLDSRSKQLAPTKEFISKLNMHLKLKREVCERHMYLIDKM